VLKLLEKLDFGFHLAGEVTNRFFLIISIYIKKRATDSGLN